MVSVGRDHFYPPFSILPVKIQITTGHLATNMYKHFDGIYHRIYERYTVPIMNPMEIFVSVLSVNVQLLFGF